jgi:hypothetical protein
MTGTKIQLYNGMLLIFTFFSCRLVYGTYQSIQVFRDVYRAIGFDTATLEEKGGSLLFANEKTVVPAWLAVSYLASNATLNSLNVYWFVKMIQAVAKRFTPASKEEVDDQVPEKVALASGSAKPVADGVRKRPDGANGQNELEFE